MPSLDENTDNNGSEATPEDDDSKNKSDSQKVKENIGETITDQAIGGPAARPLTADPNDIDESGVSNLEASMNIDFWLCPYCPNFKADTMGEMRDHITSTGDELHAGQSGWSHDKHVPGFDSEYEIVAVDLGLTDVGAPTGIVSIDDHPTSLVIETHPNSSVEIPDSFQPELPEETSKGSTPSTETTQAAETTTNKTMSNTQADPEEASTEDVVAWICPYCNTPNDTEQGIRLHIENTPGGPHEGKGGWELDDRVPGVDASGRTVAVLETSEDRHNNEILRADDVDNPPEVDISEIAEIDEYIDESNTAQESIEETDEPATDTTSPESDADTDSSGSSGDSKTPLSGKKKVNIANAWIAAGNIEDELDLKDEDKFDPEDVSKVADASYSYTYTVGRDLRNDNFDSDDLEAARDTELQEEYRPGLIERLEQKTSEPPEPEEASSEEDTSQRQLGGAIDEEGTQASESPNGPSASQGKTDRLVDISGTARTVDSPQPSPTDSSSDSTGIPEKGEDTTAASSIQIQRETTKEGEKMMVSVDNFVSVIEALERYKSGAQADIQAFGDDPTIQAAASEREYIASRIEQMLSTFGRE